MQNPCRIMGVMQQYAEYYAFPKILTEHPRSGTRLPQTGKLYLEGPGSDHGQGPNQGEGVPGLDPGGPNRGWDSALSITYIYITSPSRYHKPYP